MKTFKQIWNSFKGCIKKIFNKQENSTETNNKYHSLAPTNCAENFESYKKALEWALDNSKSENIKNIAVTGPHGSGKSSVISTFIKYYKDNHKHSKYKFLNISLANFNENEQKEKHNGENEQKEKSISENDNHDKLNRLIELSILQQLFYTVKDTEIPNSRFKKIKPISKCKYVFYSIALIVYICTLFYLIDSEKLLKFFHIDKIYEFADNKIVWWIVLFIFGLFSVIILYELLKIIKNVKINKLSYKAAELEIDKDISKSVLNNYIDEILYFFEETKYNVVIIEDLDRFNQTEIFVKLRELNQLINASGSSVVFIYAIKDDMFKDKDRSKFFDFMIPVLPVINYTNSNEILHKINKDNEYKLSPDFIEDISMFIDDMRLLYNVMNEFAILREQLDKSLDPNQLLALIIYKNLYPLDFASLGQHKGNLYEFITNKPKYIEDQVNKYNNDLEEIYSKIELSKNYLTENIKELRMLYVLASVNIMLKQGIAFQHFIVDNSRVDLIDMAKDNNFEALKSGNIQYQYHNYNNTYYYDRIAVSKFGVVFHDIENTVDNKLSYDERLKIIYDKINDTYKKDIELIKRKKTELQSMPLQKVLSDYNVDLECDDQNINMALVKRLLENGYITEDYTYYISLFHEVSLTQKDYQFILNVKTGKSMDFNYYLSCIPEIIKRLSINDFNKDCIYNLYLMDEILREDVNEMYKDKLGAVIKKLSDESEKSLEFIDFYISRGYRVDDFFKILCENWVSIWDKIDKFGFTYNRKKKIFWLILKNASIDSIASIFSLWNQKGISNCSYFLKKAGLESGKMKEIISRLEIKFETLDGDSPKEMLQFVYDNNSYILNKTMIKCMLKSQGKLDEQKFSTENYHHIMTSGCDKLIKYVEDNFLDYVKQTYLKLYTKLNEPESDYMNLLKHTMPNEIAEQVVQKVNTIIEDVSLINNPDIVNILLKYNRVSPVWPNVIESYKINGLVLANELVHFLNDMGNTTKLCKQTMPEFENTEAFCRDLVNNKELKIGSFTLIIKTLPFTFDKIDSNWNYERVKCLIENHRINTNQTTYTELKNSFKDLHLLLFKQNIDEYIDLLIGNQIEINENDFASLLKSSELSNVQKQRLIGYCTKNTLKDSYIVLDSIAGLLLENTNITVDDAILNAILTCIDIYVEKRIMVFSSRCESQDNDFIASFINSLGESYEAINDKTVKAKLAISNLNKGLLDKLVSVGFISSYSTREGIYMVNHKHDW